MGFFDKERRLCQCRPLGREECPKSAEKSLRLMTDKAHIPHLETDTIHSQWMLLGTTKSCVFPPRPLVDAYTEATSRSLKSLWFTSMSDNSRLSERIVFPWDGGWGTNPLVLRKSKQSGDCKRIGMAIKNESTC